MAYVPSFKHDIFISYAHENNEGALVNKAWITEFHNKLDTRLREHMGRPEGLEIWRDLKISGNDYFEDHIDSAFRHSAVLIAFLSPSYVASEWCRKELEGFFTHRHTQFDLKVGVKSRVFKVFILPIPENNHKDLPKELEGIRGYEFFETDQAGRTKQFLWYEKDDNYSEYIQRFDDLVQDISKLLKTMATMATIPETTPQPTGPTVFLAEVTDDMAPYRDQIKRALNQRGVQILPHDYLSATDPELEEVIREYLSTSQLSIHLVGLYYGKIPVDEERSIVQLQNDLAYTTALETNLRHIVWMPEDLAPESAPQETQREFLKSLVTMPDSSPRTHVLWNHIEELIDFVLEEIQRPLPTGEEGVVPFVHIACNTADDDQAQQLKEYLGNNEIDVYVSAPVQLDDSTELQEDYKAILQSSHAIVYIYGKVSHVWVVAQLVKAQKMVTRKKIQPHLAMAVYIGPPKEKEELRLVMQNLTIVDCRDGFEASKMALLLEKIKEIRALDTRL
jgi:hypothetical protein